jgi:Raf kinase inhibitor-like YbhB/YbcL family protein
MIPMPRLLLSLVFVPVFLFVHSMTTWRADPAHRSNHGGHMFQLTSSSFQPESDIPAKFTCQGEDISPELTWKDAPAGTKTFALILHDPDAPGPGGFTHWVVYNIPASVRQIPQDAPKGDTLPGGGVQGRNDAGKVGYMGPCPPSGTHRYYFYLYALDTELNLQPGAGKDDLEKAMQGHVLQKTELMGRYRKTSGKAA